MSYTIFIYSLGICHPLLTSLAGVSSNRWNGEWVGACWMFLVRNRLGRLCNGLSNAPPLMTPYVKSWGWMKALSQVKKSQDNFLFLLHLRDHTEMQLLPGLFYLKPGLADMTPTSLICTETCMMMTTKWRHSYQKKATDYWIGHLWCLGKYTCYLLSSSAKWDGKINSHIGLCPYDIEEN